MLRTGQYINVYGEDMEYDAYVIIGEAADEMAAEEIDMIEKSIVPILEKSYLSRKEKKDRCEKALAKIEDETENLGWGYDVIVVK